MVAAVRTVPTFAVVAPVMVGTGAAVSAIPVTNPAGRVILSLIYPFLNTVISRLRFFPWSDAEIV